MIDSREIAAEKWIEEVEGRVARGGNLIEESEKTGAWMGEGSQKSSGEDGADRNTSEALFCRYKAPLR